MGMQFGTSLQHLIDKARLPLHDLLKRFGTRTGGGHELLWACYTSGQMPGADLERHIAADPEFAAFVNRNRNQLH